MSVDFSIAYERISSRSMFVFNNTAFISKPLFKNLSILTIAHENISLSHHRVQYFSDLTKWEGYINLNKCSDIGTNKKSYINENAKYLLFPFGVLYVTFSYNKLHLQMEELEQKHLHLLQVVESEKTAKWQYTQHCEELTEEIKKLRTEVVESYYIHTTYYTEITIQFCV